MVVQENRDCPHFPGDNRIERDYDSFAPTHQFSNYVRDNESDLLYLGARYYDSGIGRFTAQDPVSLSLGDWEVTEEKTGSQLELYLTNPQTHNSYGYTTNNPLKYVDVNGEFVVDYALESNLAGWSGSLGVKFEYLNGTTELSRVDIYGGLGKSIGPSVSATALITNETLPEEETYTSYDFSGIVGHGIVGKTGGSVQADTFIPDLSSFDAITGIGAGPGTGRSVSLTANSNLRVYDNKGSTFGNIIRIAQAIITLINLKNQNYDENSNGESDDK